MAKIVKKKYWVEGAGWFCDGIVYTSNNLRKCIGFAMHHGKKAEVRESGFLLNGDKIHYQNY